MNEAFERRALLLHLGSVMRTLSCLLESERDDATIGALIATRPMLADLPLLEHVFDHMTVREFASAVLHAFCLWPQQLLDAELDRDALAAPICAKLFAGNPRGWTRYTAALSADVPWFGGGIQPAQTLHESAERDEQADPVAKTA
ncbi:hypothetical protein DF107_13200 [Burkholderia stagnalis]|uniref:Uncharacterized protein n=1 Tax=Burkholderia stagnalis TaxID=1503054 RepID=A0A125BDC3_9BURK|nr:hypothetical protein [Burkholderia stagnalis]AOK56102.1 hypothetical protein WT74_25535 [Burkholderia stagnalis]KVD93906.1 hypothetical protein WS63_05560 [Burkholderia stagnalis]KVL94059.1 hypothetical protein WT03_16725 [Burkholderia stagnalis]KVM01296.1 hypothetical protein WT02_06270 [Burkholderia stagnalis]KVM02482.1 hypothetical protein WT04_32485 [Burkholderia stagnalis]